MLARTASPARGPLPVGWGRTTQPKQAMANLEKNGRVIRDGVVDGMHFELALTPEQVRAYDWETQIQRRRR
jgi:hypothetical protein